MNGIQVYQDQENGRMQTRFGAKRAEANTNVAQKRTALGQITNIRQQPARAAKNAAPFKVFEDTENVKPAVCEDGKRAAKTSRRAPSVVVGERPSSSVVVQESKPEFESPMVLDVSCMDTGDAVHDEKTPLDRDEALHCHPEYQEDIHNYLREAELRFRPKPHYMRKQTDISTQMRTILVDWLVEVGEEYKLHDETLHLAVNYIDRFLSQMSVLRGKLQLVGTACMYIASKYEEIYPPDVGEFVYITDDTYTKKQLLRMEHLVIKVLGFDVAVPTSNVFVDLYCRQLKVSETLKCMTQYLTELALLDCDNYLTFVPSMIASSALFLAAHIVPYNDVKLSDIEKVTRYSQAEVAVCVQKLLATLKQAPEQPQQAVREKYKSDSRRAVASIPIPDLC